MRLSADEKDAAYSKWARHATVTLNGEPLQFCVTADEHLGEVDEFVRDAAGNLILECDAIAIRTRFGVVKISLPDHPDVEAKLRAP